MAFIICRINIVNRANFVIFGSIFAFRDPKEGQILIFDKCVFITFNQYQKTFHLSYYTRLYHKVDIFIVRNFSIVFDIGFVPSASKTLISWLFINIFAPNFFWLEINIFFKCLESFNFLSQIVFKSVMG